MTFITRSLQGLSLTFVLLLLLVSCQQEQQMFKADPLSVKNLDIADLPADIAGDLPTEEEESAQEEQPAEEGSNEQNETTEEPVVVVTEPEIEKEEVAQEEPAKENY